MPKLRHLPKKVVRSAYSRLPWHTKLLVPVCVLAAVVYALGAAANLLLR